MICYKLPRLTKSTPYNNSGCSGERVYLLTPGPPRGDGQIPPGPQLERGAVQL